MIPMAVAALALWVLAASACGSDVDGGAAGGDTTNVEGRRSPS